MRSTAVAKERAIQGWEMEAEASQIDAKGRSGAQSLTQAESLLRRLFSSLKAKLILPYLLLTLLTAMVGTFVVTRLVASSVRERFVNHLYEASRVAADGIVRKEDTHLVNLRLLIFSHGVAEAFQARDAKTLQDIFWPLALNNDIESITAIGLEGIEILTLAQDPASGRRVVYQGTDFSHLELVANILKGETDDLGDKYAGLINTNYGPYFYSSAPVRDASNRLLGVLMVGTHLDSLLSELKSQALADVILLDGQGRLLATTFSAQENAPAQLELSPRDLPTGDASYTRGLTLSKRTYEAVYSTLKIRQRGMGILGIALPSSYVVDTEATSRNTFTIIFSAASLAAIVIGYVLAQHIAQPILKLRSVSRAVAEGDLNQRSGLKRSDEIGELATMFDLMTHRLRRRTAQATQLYEESLRRNEELARINARLQQAQQQLIQSEKLAAVGELTAGIVHDVKNPLAVIKGVAEELHDENNLHPEVQRQLVIIRESATRATRIVGDLLKFARQSTPEMKHQDICETIRAVIRLTDYLARKGRVEVRVELPPDPVMVTYDATQIEQVLVNLIQNAIQAMHKGGTLLVRLKKNGKGVSLQVMDTGVGIAKRDLGRIFDPFYTTKPEGEGTGLGLSVSYGIISSHSGKISVESELGKGTCFTIMLPAEQMQQIINGG